MIYGEEFHLTGKEHGIWGRGGILMYFGVLNDELLVGDGVNKKLGVECGRRAKRVGQREGRGVGRR